MSDETPHDPWLDWTLPGGAHGETALLLGFVLAATLFAGAAAPAAGLAVLTVGLLIGVVIGFTRWRASEDGRWDRTAIRFRGFTEEPLALPAPGLALESPAAHQRRRTVLVSTMPDGPTAPGTDPAP